MSEVALVWVFAEATCDPVTVERQSGQSVVSGRRALLGPKTGSRGLSLRGRIGNLKLTKAISS